MHRVMRTDHLLVAATVDEYVRIAARLGRSGQPAIGLSTTGHYRLATLTCPFGMHRRDLRVPSV